MKEFNIHKEHGGALTLESEIGKIVFFPHQITYDNSNLRIQPTFFEPKIGSDLHNQLISIKEEKNGAQFVSPARSALQRLAFSGLNASEKKKYLELVRSEIESLLKSI